MKGFSVPLTRSVYPSSFKGLEQFVFQGRMAWGDQQQGYFKDLILCTLSVLKELFIVCKNGVWYWSRMQGLDVSTVWRRKMNYGAAKELRSTVVPITVVSQYLVYCPGNQGVVHFRGRSGWVATHSHPNLKLPGCSGRICPFPAISSSSFLCHGSVEISTFKCALGDLQKPFFTSTKLTLGQIAYGRDLYTCLIF